MSQSKQRIKAVRLCWNGRQLYQNFFFMQNVKQIFAYLWLKNEEGDIPVDHF